MLRWWRDQVATTVQARSHQRISDLYQATQLLIDTTFKADQELKPLLAYMELKSGKCTYIYYTIMDWH